MAGRPRAGQVWVYLALAVVLAGVPILLFYREPIAYAHLIAEDFAGEYASAVAFAMAGLLFWRMLSARPNAGGERWR